MPSYGRIADIALKQIHIWRVLLSLTKLEYALDKIKKHGSTQILIKGLYTCCGQSVGILSIHKKTYLGRLSRCSTSTFNTKSFRQTVMFAFDPTDKNFLISLVVFKTPQFYKCLNGSFRNLDQKIPKSQMKHIYVLNAHCTHACSLRLQN